MLGTEWPVGAHQTRGYAQLNDGASDGMNGVRSAHAEQNAVFPDTRCQPQPWMRSALWKSAYQPWMSAAFEDMRIKWPPSDDEAHKRWPPGRWKTQSRVERPQRRASVSARCRFRDGSLCAFGESWPSLLNARARNLCRPGQRRRISLRASLNHSTPLAMVTQTPHWLAESGTVPNARFKNGRCTTAACNAADRPTAAHSH
jgi:hypothetical protein